MEILKKIRRKITRIRLQPIHVYCFHHVSEEFDSSYMKAVDWCETNDFKRKLADLKGKGYSFISLNDAYKKIKNDIFRMHKYAVITFDDGYSDILDILPWLIAHEIPSTLFINGKYLDGTSFRESPLEMYITKDQLFSLTSSYIEIAEHGWEHISANKMTDSEFEDSITNNRKILSPHPRYINFWAYTYGSHRLETDQILISRELIPVLINGKGNYNNPEFVDRELL